MNSTFRVTTWWLSTFIKLCRSAIITSTSEGWALDESKHASTAMNFSPTTSNETHDIRMLILNRLYHQNFPIKNAEWMGNETQVDFRQNNGAGECCENCKTINDRMGQLVEKSRENLFMISCETRRRKKILVRFPFGIHYRIIGPWRECVRGKTQSRRWEISKNGKETPRWLHNSPDND